MEQLDRCDGCSASAYVRFQKNRSQKILDFCGHHANQHLKSLTSQRWKKIIDNREEPSKSPAEVS